MDQTKSVSSHLFRNCRKYFVTPLDYGLITNPSNSNSSIQSNSRQSQILKDTTNKRQVNQAGRQSQYTVKQNRISPRKNRERIIELENTPDSAHYYKKLGNQSYNKGEYASALEHYNKAIELNDTESVFYSNRARCYKRLGDLDKAYEDAKTAVELDDKNTKAYLLCGQLLAEKGKNERDFDLLNKAVNKITKALSLCASHGEKEFEQDIKHSLLKVKKLIWDKQEAKNKQKKADTLDFIKELINKDSSLEDETIKEQKYQEVLKIAGDPSRKFVKEIPDYLCCKITMEMFDHPTVAPSGISYEKEPLEKHLRSGKSFDPTTREKMSLEFIHQNKSLELLMDDFLAKHPWAYELDEDENEENCDIKF